LVDGFRQLSPESRYRRSMALINELSEYQLRFLTELDYVDHFAWVALEVGHGRPPSDRVARYVRVPSDLQVWPRRPWP
jgi:hypothetical protein